MSATAGSIALAAASDDVYSVAEKSAVAAPVAGRVSIILPAYNCETTIAAAVRSCLAQSYDDVEIIVVNDGSTDRTLEVLEEFGGDIRILTQENLGLAAARNAGTRAATGEFVAWMDGDDLARPERLKLQVSVLKDNPSFALVSSDFSAFVGAQPDFDSSHISFYYHSISRLGGIPRIYRHSDVSEAAEFHGVRWGHVYDFLLAGNFVHPPTVMVRRQAFDDVGFFDETIRYSSDYDLIIRIARTGPFAFIDTSLLRYRISETQMSHVAGDKVALETVRILEKVRAADPGIYSRHPELFQQRFAESFILAAEMLGQSDRPQALRLLLRGLKYRLLLSRAFPVLVKLTLPHYVLDAIRRLRQAPWRN